RTARAVILIGAADLVFRFLEIGQHVVKAPADIAELAPAVIILVLAAHIEQAVDRARSAQHFSARLKNLAAAESRLGLGLVHPVDTLVLEQFSVADRHVDPDIAVLRAGLEQQHGMSAVGAQAIGEHASSRTRADDDIVEFRDVMRAVLVHPCPRTRAALLGRAWLRPQPGADPRRTGSGGSLKGQSQKRAISIDACASGQRQSTDHTGGNRTMKISRRLAVASFAALALLARGAASHGETIRVGLPTKTYWPTTVAETAVRQKLFEKEGITAELTIYRSGAETFEGMAAGAADIILDPPSLVSAGRKKGVMSKIVANATMGNFGWQLMVPTKSTLDVKDLNGKKVAITAAGSGSDILALWTIQDRKIDFTRVPVGGGGLVPNLLAGNVDAAVVYSPLSYQILKSGEGRTLIDYYAEVPSNLTGGWIVTDKFVAEKPQVVQKALNALYGAVAFMRANRDATVKLIADLYEIPPDIAALEYENSIMKLETDGDMAAQNVL